MPRVVHFEIDTENPEKTAKFYNKAFGWEFTKVPNMDYWLINTGKENHGINGGMTLKKLKSTKLTLDVNDIDKYIEKVKSQGAEIIMPKFTIDKVGYLAIFKDNEGNEFGMMQSDPEAKKEG